MPGTIRPPSHLRINRLRKISLRLNRAAGLIALGTALAVAGAGTANAADSGPASGRHQSASEHVTARVQGAKHQAKRRPASAAQRHRRHYSINTWRGLTHVVAHRSGWLPAKYRLLPAGLSGPQAFMTMTASREHNAATIVGQALKKHMGLRSAVIAVATAMQESTLENLSYGDRDSLGLFQQRPSMGWGSRAEVTNPVYASDAFLNALRQYQASHGAWATQPLWEAAQGVQRSGFPYAYAKWEDQAAHVVFTVTRRMY